MTSSAYAAIRDDNSFHSLSINEKEFLREGSNAPSPLRIDGRTANEIRKVRVNLGRWYNGAECTVQWGTGTRVTSLCSAELVPPLPDRPNEGIINFTVDLSPMAGTAFRQATAANTAASAAVTMNVNAPKGPNIAERNQRYLANRVLRCLERTIVVGGALDAESLVVTPSSWVWRVTVALTLLDDGGNVLDACVLAAMAALRHYRKPHVAVDMPGDAKSFALPRLIPATLKEPTPLALHHTPVSISFALLPAIDVASESPVTTVVDPEKREELVQFGTMCIAMNVHGELCLLDFGGGHELPPDQLLVCLAAASAAVQYLCQELEATLARADNHARRETLERLQQAEQVKVPLGFRPKTSLPAPFVDFDDNRGDKGCTRETSKNKTAWTEGAEAADEEEYRVQALDYTKGHQTTSLRKDTEDPDRKTQKTGSLMLASLVQAAASDKMSQEAGV